MSKGKSAQAFATACDNFMPPPTARAFGPSNLAGAPYIQGYVATLADNGRHVPILEKLLTGRLQENRSAAVDKVTITRVTQRGLEENERTWLVMVAINDKRPEERTVTDPFIKQDEYYRNCSYCPRHYFDFKKCPNCPARYFASLVSQLGLEDVKWRRCRQREIFIHESYQVCEGRDNQRVSSNDPSILSLFWELLEDVNLWRCHQLTKVVVSRTLTFREEAGATKQQLCMEEKAEYRILLVIARSFRQHSSESYIDCHPGLVLGPLLQIALWCNRCGELPRVFVDVVRPGTMDEFRLSLERHGRYYYDLVHLDMHGKLVPGPSERATPCLRFAKRYTQLDSESYSTTAISDKDESLYDVKAETVAKLLSESGITSVALNACLSSYAEGDVLANMCYVFLRHGASHVSAMSSRVLVQTAQLYYAGFYHALLLNGENFLSAAAFGRKILRGVETQTTNALIPTYYRRIPNYPDHGHDGEDSLPRYRERVLWRWAIMALLLRVCAGSLAACTVDNYCLMRSEVLQVLNLLLAAILWLVSIHLTASPGLAFFVAFLLRVFISLLYACALGNYCPTWSTFLVRLISSFSLAVICWYGSVYIMRPVQCPLWIWEPNPVNMLELKEPIHKQSRSNQVEIQHLVLEDVLELEATQGAIYLWSSATEAGLGTMVASLAKVWVNTDFVDTVEIVSATAFTWWLWILRILPWCWIARHSSNVAPSNGMRRRRLLIITDIDELWGPNPPYGPGTGVNYSDTTPEPVQHALSRMAEFVVSRSETDLPEQDMGEVPPGTDITVDHVHDGDLDNGRETAKTYLIITGSYANSLWQKLPWPTPKVMSTIGRARPHNNSIMSSGVARAR